MPKSKLLRVVCICSLVLQVFSSLISPLAVFASVPDASSSSALISSPVKYWLPVSGMKLAKTAPRSAEPTAPDPSSVSAPLRQGVTMDVDILSSPWAILDSNSPGSLAYPHVFVIEAMISNTHAISTVNDVMVELDYEDDQGYWQLLEGEDGSRTIPTLGPYEAYYVYWFARYPGTIGADHTYTVTVYGTEVHTATQSAPVQTHAYLSTGNSGLIQTNAVVTVGVAFTVSVDYALGTNPASLTFSPVGNTDFNPGAYRLLESKVRFYGGGGFQQTFANQLYFATIPAAATNAQATYTFIALTPRNTQLCPYTGVGYQNGQYKYDQFYCVASRGTTIPIEGTLSFAMTKQASRSYIQQDESVAYTIYYTNSGTLPLSYVWIWDDVPAGLGTITSVTPNTGTIVGEQARWYLGRVPAGATGHVSLTFAVGGQGQDIDDQTQGINHAFFGINPGELPATAALTSTSSITVIAPTITVMKTDGETMVDTYPGSNMLTYTVRVTNSGSISATKVLITDVVPSSVTLGAVSPPTSTQQGRTLIWSVPPIAANGGVFTISIPVTVDVTVPNGTVLTNAVDVRYENSAGYPFTVKSDVDTTTVRGPVLAINKSAEPDAVLIGAAPALITYTLHYTNSGPVAATGVVVTDRIPISTTFVPGSCAGCVTYTVGSDVWVSWTPPELSSSGSVAFSVEITDIEAKAIVNGDSDGYGITSDQTGLVSGSPVTTTVSKDAALFDGYTFHDLNGNGQLDAGEPGIAGVAVTLTQATTPFKTTDSNGYYSFTVESQGLVAVSAALPTGYFRTTSGTVYTFSVLGVPTQTINFGYASNASGFGVIYGTVYEDANHDGLRVGEEGLAGIVITSTLNSIATPTTTDPFGRYVFSYTVVNGTPVTIKAGVTPPYVPTTPDEVSTLTQRGVEQEINFGYFDGIKITGQVFSDDNVNGERDTGEGALDTPATVTAREISLAVTDFFTFYLSAGSAPIEIVETDPAGYVSTNAIPRQSSVTRIDMNTLRIATPAAGTTYSGDFGDVLVSGVVTISGYVWNDNGAGGGTVSDGVWDNPLDGRSGAEPGLAGAVVGISNGMTQTTDGTGQFVLYALPSSTITLNDQTTGYVSTNAVPGDQYASKLDNDTLVFSGLTTPGMASVHNLFGNVAPSATARITGTVFDDANENSAFDAGDTGIPGVTVTLQMNSNTIVVLTGSDGQYEFAIAPGTDAWISTARPTAYYSGTLYPTTPESVLVHPATGGTVYPDNNFGYSDDTSVAVIHGLVFDDDNSNGEQEVGEPGLAGVTVTLSLNGGTPITMVTQGNGLVTGTFSFSVTEMGIYAVHEYDLAGYRSTTPNTLNVNVSALGASYHVEFGDTNNQDTASVYGTVFDDLNSNGQQDPDEPGLAGVMISVGELTATTKSEGQFTYGFILNLPGYYLVQEQDPARPGFHSTTPDAVNLYADRGYSYIVNFGDTDASDYSIVTGIVFNDINGDGEQGASEPGIEDVPVTLVALDGSPITTTQTISYGIYQLRTNVTGFASVVETDLPGYHSTTPNTVTIQVALGQMYKVDFGDSDNVNLTSFYGAVFNDQDADGLRALTEPALSGVTVVITGPFDFGAPDPYVANAWGQYTFLIENPGVYTVTEAGHLPGYVSTNAIPGDPDYVSRVDADTLQATVLPATLGSDLGDNLFGDAFPVQFSSMAYSVNEPSGPATITVTLGGAASVTVTVDYATLDNTALDTEDYIATTGTLTFTPGLTELTFTVPITDDYLVEGIETLTLTLSNAQNATVFGNHPAVLSIVDDDALVSIARRTDAAEPSSNGDFVVSLSQTIPDPVTINYTAGGSATADADYAALPGTVTIPAGELTATVTIAVQDDDLVEGDESVLLTLTTTDDPRVVVDTVNDGASLTIVDDDWATVGVAVSHHAEEPDIDGWFVISLSNLVTQSVTVSYTVGGTASAGDDYQALPGSVVVAANTLSVTVPVTVIDDVLIEGSETVILTLSGTDNPWVSAGTANSATLTIRDDDTARVTVLVAQNAAEPDINGQFVITMSKPATTSVTISYTVGGTAGADVDYVALSGAVVIPTDTLLVTVTVAIRDDFLVEGDETVALTLTESDHPFVEVGTPDSATLTIEDNDTAEVSIAMQNDGAEPNVDGRFVVLLTHPVATAVVVSYTVGGSATGGVDYAALTGTVTIPAGELTATVTIAVQDDDLVEGDETVLLALTTTDNARVTVDTVNDEAPLTIVDNDWATVSVAAGQDAAEPNINGWFVISLSQPVTQAVTVSYTVGGTASPGADYEALPGSVTVAAGTLSITVPVTVTDDALIEGSETVVLTLEAATDNPQVSAGTPNSATLTIADDDNAKVTVFTAQNAAEPDVNGSFVITISKPATTSVTISYTVGGTAGAGVDYAALSGVVVIPTNTLAVTLTVAVQDDLLVEGDETVALTLTESDNIFAEISTPASAALTITDDDTAEVSIVVQNDGAEPDVDGRFVVSLTQRVSTAVVVSYTVGGSAIGVVDYMALPGAVTIPAGELSVTIVVDVIDDTVYEGNETVQVTLGATNHLHVGIGESNTATLILGDNDRPTVEFSHSDYTVAETAGSALITVTLTGDTNMTTTVQYATSEGTATAGSDYVKASGVLTFAPGTNLLTFTVPILEDMLFENNETVGLLLTDPVNADLGSTNPATLTIIDDSSGTAVIVGTVFEDLNGSGVQDDGEVGIPDVMITLDNNIITTTDGDGHYSFSTQTPGVHVVVETDLEGYFSTTPNEIHVDTAIGNIYQVNFGDVQEIIVEFATLYGTVFEDNNGNGAQDAGELGIPDVTITLDSLRTTTTNMYGGYTFSNTVAGAHTLVETDLDGYFSTTPNTVVLNVVLGNGYLVNFGDARRNIVEFATLYGTVFEDNNGNGVQDAGELGIPDVTLTLDGLRTTTTNLYGGYTFSTTVTGVHTLVETDPAGYFSTTPNEVHVNVALDEAYQVNFGDARRDIVQFATIHGTVFEDVDGDGVWDGTELGIVGVLIELDGTYTATTDIYGNYTFSTLVEGVHTVVETDPEGYFSTTPNEVNVSVVMDTDYRVDFGDAQEVISDFASIYGFVFEDANGDGVQNENEVGIANVTVTLDESTTTTTDDLGRYTFSTQVTGVHSIVETDLEGYFSTTPNTVTLDVKALRVDYQVDFGDAREDVANFASLYGTVFDDADSDGLWDWDSGEVGLSSVTITLDNNTTITTDHLGRFTFSTQVAGSHTVVETDPEGYLSTTPNTVTVSVVLGNGYLANFGDVLAPYCQCGPDAFEDDDTTASGKTLTAGVPQARNFCDDATDWLVFAAEAGDVYTITTSSWGQRADTVVALFDRDGHTLIAENDDYEGATDFSSRLVWEAPSSGNYFIRITNRAGLSGCLTDYDVELERQNFQVMMIYLPLVLRTHSAMALRAVSQEIIFTPMGIIHHTCADAYEVDDTWQQAHLIAAGSSQIHSFDSNPALYAADKDFVIFTIDSGRTVTFTIAPMTQTATLLELYSVDGMALGVTETEQLVWEASASGTYYLSASPLMETFGCVADAGYQLTMQISSLSKLYLPMILRSSIP